MDGKFNCERRVIEPMLKDDEKVRLEELKKGIVDELKKLTPDDIESVIISLVEDLWDEMEMTNEPILVKSYITVDSHLSGERVIPWADLVDAIATLEAYRRLKRREPIVVSEF